MKFHIASPKDILEGRTSDVYFSRTAEILKKSRVHKRVKAEFAAGSLPYEWGVFAGLEEIRNLLADIPVKISGLEEGTFFRAGEPVLTIEGDYLDFGVYETAILGLMCQASGIAVKAARLKKLARDKTVLSFGARRMHPVLAPMIERNAYLGGCDGVSVVQGAELISIEPSGTMPHALILMLGDEEKAFRLFNKMMPPKLKRVALVDTFSDEKFASLLAAKTMKDRLYGVRLDTPSSRKGDLLKIAQEVRWELDQQGFNSVKIFVSGGLEEGDVDRLFEYVDGFGIGTALSNSPVINFSMDIVEINGKPVGKRGKLSGEKRVFRCPACYYSTFKPKKTNTLNCYHCKKRMTLLTKPISKTGKPSIQTLRQSVLKQLATYHVFANPFLKGR